jgi:hypothetical protein
MPDPDETVADDGTWRNSPDPRPRRDDSPRSAEARPAPSRPPARTSPALSRPPARTSPKRRPGRFLRFVEILLSIVVLVTVPLAAMVLAYSYGTGEPYREAALELAREIRDLVRT